MTQLLGMEEIGTSDQIDWTAETALPHGLESSSASLSISQLPGQPRITVLTGASGLPGKELSRSLIIRDNVEKVICIAVRDCNDERRAFFSQLNKVEYYEGDLRSPCLGLTEEQVSRIFQIADTVIHNGADVSHLKTYSSLRLANLNSTQELVKLCLPRRIPLHYISTSGVTMYTTSESFAEVSVRNSEPPPDGRYGYVASKWASEVYLENANACYGLPVYIHRPSSVIRPESDMMGDNPAADILQNMLAYSKRIHAVPATFGLRGIVDLVHPSTVTSKVIRAVMAHTPGPDNRVHYIHESGDMELYVAQIGEFLSKETGEEVQEVSLEDWIVCAQKIGLSNAVAAVFRGLGSEKQMNFPRLLRK